MLLSQKKTELNLPVDKFARENDQRLTYKAVNVVDSKLFANVMNRDNETILD